MMRRTCWVALLLTLLTGCGVHGEEAVESHLLSPTPTVTQVSARETARSLENWWETAIEEDLAYVCRLYDDAPNSAVRMLRAPEGMAFDAEEEMEFLDEHCVGGVPEQIEASVPTPTVAPTATPEPPQEPEPWERYGEVPGSAGDYVTEDLLLTIGPMVCADIAEGNRDGGFLVSFLVANGVKPIPANVYTAVRAVTAACPDLQEEFVMFLDAYDAEHAPYPY